MRNNLIALPFIIFVLGFVTLLATFAYLNDTSRSLSNIFLVANSFPIGSPLPSTVPSPAANALLINEVFNDSDNPKEWVELFNPTEQVISLTGWIIEDGGATDSFPSVSIPAGGYGVVITNNSTVTVPVTAVVISLSNGTIGNGLNGTGDKLILKEGTTNIDAMSYGVDSSILNPAPSVPPANASLARIPNGLDTNTKNDWIIDNSPTVGIANN